MGYADGFAPVEIQRPQKEEDEDDGGMFSGSIVVSETLSGSGQKTEQKPNLTLLGLLSPQMNKLTDEMCIRDRRFHCVTFFTSLPRR